MNKGITIGIIIAIVIGISAAVIAFSYNQLDENPDLIDSEGDSEPNQFTANVRDEIGFQEKPP